MLFDLCYEEDQALVDQLKSKVSSETQSTISVLNYLNEIDRRRLYLKDGYSTLYIYCITELGYSESAASQRTRGARALRSYPEVERLLKERALNLSTLAMLYPVLNPENRDDLLRLACGKSQGEVARLVAKYSDPVIGAIPDRISPIRVIMPRVAPAGQGKLKSSEQPNSGEPADKHRIIFAAGNELVSKIESAKRLLSGTYPGGVALEMLFSEALDLLLSKRSPSHRQSRRNNRSEAASIDDSKDQNPVMRRNIPARVRDEVFLRDRGQCSYIAPNGRRCDATWDLEIDHIKPYSLGGDHSVENLRLLCRAHNVERVNSDLQTPDQVHSYSKAGSG